MTLWRRERERVGNVGHEGTTIDWAAVEPCREHRYRAWQQLPVSLPWTEDAFMYCANELTRHMATPTTTDWEQVVRLGRYLKTDPGFDCGTSFRRRRANLKRSQTQIGQVAEEHAAVQQEDTQLQDLTSSKCGAKHKLLWRSVQRKPNCTA